ncbi:MAG: DNA-binding CsgD family transcriptional regulator, partial [Parasphingorhabdus sp.]
WLQILKTLHISANSQELSSANLLESLVTIQVEQQSTGHSTFAMHPGSAQFLLFNRITKVLADFAKSRCVVIVIDDLHWADRSSLLLLTHLCEKLLELSILVVGAYRDMEISRKHPLFQTLGDINRAAKLRRVRLKGLSEEDVSSFITKTTEAEIPAKVLAALYEKTEGNPLFVSEVAGILKQSPVNTTLENLELEIPDGIQEAIGRRLNFLSEDCANLLSCASVVGRRFSIRILKKIIDEFNSVQIFQIIEEASGRGVIRVLDEAAGEFQFSHVLIRDILYGELSLAQKILLHGRVADSLVALQQGGSLQSNGEIARHYYQALQSGQGEQAVQYAVRAAEHAYKLSAYDEAASYYDLALEVLNFDSSLDQKQRAGILLQHSLCRHAAGLDVRQTLEALNHCLEVARENEQWRIFAEVACHKVYQGRTSERSSDALIDLTEALKHIEGDPGLIANVMAHRAMALRFCAYIGDAERVAYDAIQIADESGDPGARINALCMALLVLRGRPEKLSERISLGERALTIAREKHYHLNDTDALEWLILSCQESGDMKRVAEYIGQLNQSVEKYHVAKARYFATGASASLALFQGQWQRAETFIEAAFELGEGTLDGGAEGVYGAQMFLLNRELGRLPMISGALQQLLDDKTPMWAPGLLATYTDLNMLDQAVPLFDQLVANNFQQIAEDEMLLTCLVYLSETCVALNRVDAANGLYQRLLPYTGQMVSHPTAVCYGPADMYLGMLASMMNDFDESDRLFTQASQLANNAGNNMWIAHIKFRQAQVLRRHNYQGGKVIFQRLINEARDVAHGLGMVNILTKLDYIEKTQSNSKKADTDGLTHRELEILQLIAEGKSNKIIAAELNRSLATVATHVRSILNKTHTANRTEAAAYARERGGSSR